MLKYNDCSKKHYSKQLLVERTQNMNDVLVTIVPVDCLVAKSAGPFVDTIKTWSESHKFVYMADNVYNASSCVYSGISEFEWY